MTSSKSAAASPRVQALLRDGERLLARGDLPGAGNAATCALALAPQLAAARLLFARVQRRSGRSAEALQTLREAAQAQPGDADVAREYGAALRDSGEFDAAVVQLRAALALRADAESWFELGLALDRNSEPEASLDAAREVQRRLPQHVANRYLLARNLMALGQIEAAAALYRELARLPSEAAKAWFALLDLKTQPITDAELARIRALERDPRQSRDDRMRAGFALGLACEAAGLPAEAVAAFTRANALQRRAWDAATHAQRMTAIRQAFAPPLPSGTERRGEQAIFIVGLPRSGSTLIEQILAAHPDVDAASELPYVQELLAAESTRRGVDFPQWAAQATSGDWQRLGEAYLERTRRYQGRLRFTDKMPENWPYVGAIRAMLPGARIIGCQRDLLETCWSCYKQLFAPGQAGYSYDLDDLAAYAADFRRLWRHWQSLWPDATRTQSFEALLAEPEAQIRALLDFCGLPYSQQCMNFHTAQRATRTASAAQVRRPLAASTARAGRYGELLAPLAAALKRVESEGE